MVNKRKMTRRSLLLVAVLMVASVEIASAGGVGKDNTIFSLDLNWIKMKADVVLAGRLISVPSPYDIMGPEFYQIVPDDIIDGKLATNSLFVVMPGLHSLDGTPVEPEENMRYMFFLRKVDFFSRYGFPEKCTAYSSVNNWKGIISLDKAAAEKRAVDRLEFQYGIRIDAAPQDFIDAIKMSIDSGAGVGKRYSGGARNLYRTLGLINSKKKIEKEGRRTKP